MIMLERDVPERLLLYGGVTKKNRSAHEEYGRMLTYQNMKKGYFELRSDREWKEIQIIHRIIYSIIMNQLVNLGIRIRWIQFLYAGTLF